MWPVLFQSHYRAFVEYNTKVLVHVDTLHVVYRKVDDTK